MQPMPDKKRFVLAPEIPFLRKLGTDRFGESIFATLKEELTAQGFERHDAPGTRRFSQRAWQPSVAFLMPIERSTLSRTSCLKKPYIDLPYAY